MPIMHKDFWEHGESMGLIKPITIGEIKHASGYYKFLLKLVIKYLDG